MINQTKDVFFGTQVPECNRPLKCLIAIDARPRLADFEIPINSKANKQTNEQKLFWWNKWAKARTPCTIKSDTLICAAVRSHSHRVRRVQPPPGQSADGIPALSYPGPPGSGARSPPCRVSVGQDPGVCGAAARCPLSRGRWVIFTCGLPPCSSPHPPRRSCEAALTVVLHSAFRVKGSQTLWEELFYLRCLNVCFHVASADLVYLLF